MQWIKRYLAAAAPYLPAQQRDELLSELESDLQDQLADGAAANEKQLVGALGHPALWAQRFQTDTALIGGNLLPLYWLTLRWLILGLLTVHGGIALADILTSGVVAPISRLWQIGKDSLNLFVWLFTWVTLAFALFHQQIERLQLLQHWQPEQLPPLQPAWASIERSDAVFGLVANLLFAALLLGQIPVFDHPALTALANALPSLPLAISAGAGLALGWACMHFWHLLVPHWSRPSLAAHLTLNGLCLMLVLVLAWQIGAQTVEPDASDWALRARWSLLTVLVTVAGVSGYELVRDLRRYHQLGQEDDAGLSQREKKSQATSR